MISFHQPSRSFTVSPNSVSDSPVESFILFLHLLQEVPSLRVPSIMSVMIEFSRHSFAHTMCLRYNNFCLRILVFRASIIRIVGVVNYHPAIKICDVTKLWCNSIKFLLSNFLCCVVCIPACMHVTHTHTCKLLKKSEIDAETSMNPVRHCLEMYFFLGRGINQYNCVPAAFSLCTVKCLK